MALKMVWHENWDETDDRKIFVLPVLNLWTLLNGALILNNNNTQKYEANVSDSVAALTTARPDSEKASCNVML